LLPGLIGVNTRVGSKQYVYAEQRDDGQAKINNAAGRCRG
jgi:hypothetical protein